MIIVTGATGQLGHLIAEKLVDRVPADHVGVSGRDSEKAADLKALGVRVRRGDFADPESLPHAFEGATQVLIVSSNARSYGGDPLAQHRAAIDAARAVGARRVIYTSHMAANAASAFPPALDHAATEDMLRQSGLAWTALRHGFYAASGISMLGDALETGVIESPPDGKIAWTAHVDLAEAAAIILADEGRYDGPTPPLTGSQALDLADLAGIASEVLSKPIRREMITDDDLRSNMAAQGVPERVTAQILGLSIASRNGEFIPVDPTLERLLGRRPAQIRELIAQKIGS